MLKRTIITTLITVILGLYPFFGFAADIYVITPVSRTTINSAIASASPGDTVIIPNGTYDALSDTTRPITIATSGSAENQITLKAETPGGVKFTGTFRITATGNYWIINGFNFEGIRSHAPLTLSIGVIHIDGDNVRVTNCLFKNTGQTGDKWGGYIIRHDTGADYGEIDYNTFENWASCSAVAPLAALNLHAHHNYFTSPAESDHDSAMHNGSDPLDIVYTESNNVIEYNYFAHCNGDGEIISNKISSATYRYNVFDGRNSLGENGTLCIRKGNNCTIEGNCFFSLGRNNGGSSLALYGENHKIINNYFEDAASGGSAIWIHSAPDTVQTGSGYVRCKNIQVLNNTIVDSNTYAIWIGSVYPIPDPEYDPENLTFKNNIITQSAGYLVADYGHIGTWVWENNLHYNQGTATYWKKAQAGGDEPGSAITHADSNLTQGEYIKRLQVSSSNAIGKGMPLPNVTFDIDGHTRNDLTPCIGADEYSTSDPARTPISLSDVGVSWMRETTLVQAPKQLRIEPSGS